MGNRLKVDPEVELPEVMDITSFRKLLQSNGEYRKSNVPVEGHPHAKPIPTVVFGKQVKTVELPSKTKAFFIPGQVLSSKNHKRILRKRLNGKEQLQELIKNRAKHVDGNPTRKYRYYIGNTESVNQYKEKTAKYYRGMAEEFRQASAGMSPVYVEFFFVRNSHAVNWDFANMVQLVQDQMRDYGWVIDDNVTNLLPVPPLDGPTIAFDHYNPGVRITILKFKNDLNKQ